MYLKVTDHVIYCYVGPFSSKEEAQAHADWLATRDGGEVLGMVPDVHPDEIIFTPEEDRAEYGEDVTVQRKA